MKKYIRYLFYILVAFSVIIVAFVLYHLVNARITDRQKEVYKERLDHFKKSESDR